MRLIGQGVEGGRVGLPDRVRAEADRLTEMPAGEPSGLGGRHHFVRTRRIGHASLGDGHPILAEVHAADAADLRHVVVVEGGGEGLPVGTEGNHEEIGSIGDTLHVREACELVDHRVGAELIGDRRGLELEVRGLRRRQIGGKGRLGASRPSDRPHRHAAHQPDEEDDGQVARPALTEGGTEVIAGDAQHRTTPPRTVAIDSGTGGTHAASEPPRPFHWRHHSTSVVQPRSDAKGVSLTPLFVSAPRTGLWSPGGCRLRR